MNNRKIVRLTESQLHNIIAESVEKVLNEKSRKYDPNEWRDEYYDPKSGYTFQAKGSGLKKQVRQIRKSPVENDGWEDQYEDSKGYTIQSKGDNPNKEWRWLRK